MKLKHFSRKLLAVVLTLAISLSFGGVAFAADELVVVEPAEADLQDAGMEIVEPDAEAVEDAVSEPVEEVPQLGSQAVQVGTLDALVAAIAAAGTGGDANIVLTADITVDSTISLTPAGNKAVTIDGGGFTLKRGDAFLLDLISVPAGGNLTLKNIVLDGSSGAVGVEANAALVATAGQLTLDSGAKIQNNTNIVENTDAGAGVTVSNGGVLTINDGALVSNNSMPLSFGGGMFVATGGAVVMNGGEVKYNYAHSGGGGAAVDDGATFTMNGGTMSGNEGSLGGCIFSHGVVTMNNDAAISANTGGNNGGGVWIHEKKAKLVMTGNSKITDNQAEQSGGVIADSGAVIEMSGNSSISGNTANGYGGLNSQAARGGGVIVLGTCSLYMKDNASITGNKLGESGGDPIGGADVYLDYTDGADGMLYVQGGVSIGASSRGVVSAGIMSVEPLEGETLPDNIIVNGALTVAANIAVESASEESDGAAVAIVDGTAYTQLTDTDLEAFAYGDGSYELVLNRNSTAILLKKNVIPVERIEITPAKKSVYAGNAYGFEAKVYPENATNKDIEWVIWSGNASKATVTADADDQYKATVETKLRGRVNVTVKAKDGSGVLAKALVVIKNKPSK